MARLNSFYLPTGDWPDAVGGMVELAGSEAHHMVAVLRTEADQVVRLFDGHGKDGLFDVVAVTKKRVTLKAVAIENHPQPNSGVTLAIGWGKSKRRNYLFEKLVELHGYGVLFWRGQRSQGAIPSTPKDAWLDKCVQAAKQCGAVYLPTLATVADGINDLVTLSDSFDQCFLAWESQDARTALSPSMLASGKSLIVIGPEGGLTDTEAEQLIQGGYRPVTLGQTIMRWETAATYCLSLGWQAQQERA